MLRMTSKEGFTLVELSLSMVFISILSISIVLIIGNTLAAYRRGLVLSRLNSVGTELTDEMRASVQKSSVKTLNGACVAFYSSSNGERCRRENAYGLVLVKKNSKIVIRGDEEVEVPIYGAFCTGSYSYIWNSGYFESDDAVFAEKDNGWAKLIYTTGEKDEDGNDKVQKIVSSAEDENRPFRLLKVEDGSHAVCAAMMGGGYRDETKIKNEVEIAINGFSVDFEPEDILVADSSNNLAIYDLDVSQPVISPGGNNAFYSVSFILGTTSDGVNVMARGNACVAPTDYEKKDFENFDYCAINKFNFAVQVNGGVGK